MNIANWRVAYTQPSIRTKRGDPRAVQGGGKRRRTGAVGEGTGGRMRRGIGGEGMMVGCGAGGWRLLFNIKNLNYKLPFNLYTISGIKWGFTSLTNFGIDSFHIETHHWLGLPDLTTLVLNLYLFVSVKARNLQSS